jgi:hypothetical protein
MNRIVAVILVVAAFVFVSAGPSHARPGGGHGFAGGHSGAHVEGHRGFQGPPASPSYRGFDGHRAFHRGGQARVFVGVAPFIAGPAYAYGWPADPGEVYSVPAYPTPPPSYWYYCPSAGGYYPDVPACPEPWVPVPTQ